MDQQHNVLVFDVIETIFSLDALSSAFHSLGLPEYTKDLFFAQLLRDAFAVSATGTYVPFANMARGTLDVLLNNLGVSPADSVIERILPVFGQLNAHPDVPKALALAKNKGMTVVFFTNGSKSNTEGLITKNGLDNWIDHVVSIDSMGQWKPVRNVYQGALQKVGGETGHSAMIAAHAWDTNGAMNAGMLAGWVRRQDSSFHPAMSAPAFVSDNLVELVDRVSDSLLAGR
ncbi:2-haloacid dehalogenase [Marinobacter persicus]|uniref:(S)-2-haloacid dehalogenase n=1 Tax=Marinobacter persicus TaxID=930118 RepID=A0A1I3VCP1_9GAMM|nr:haloacid dehalogenase type II [Marinobacter persicus]GHD41410.1 dehalogenase [Marinobacter persicus]SFJ91947.1 2-haloacid dehalogenase [Marinobacter persicus]